MAETIKGINVVIGAETTGLSKALSEVNKKSKDIQSELKQVEKLLKLDPGNTELVAQKQKLLSDAISNTSEKLKSLKAAQEQVNAQFANGDISEGQYRAFQRELASTEQQLASLEKAAGKTSKSLEEIGKSMQAAGKNISDVGGTLTKGVTVPLVALGAAAGKAAIDFESAFAGVIKTVDATDAELADLKQGIRDMSKDMPTAATEIAGVAEAAGQLGIETPNILKFTRTMADLGVATNMSSEEAATSLARLANITQMPQTEFDKLGSTVVALGNNLATTESEIVAMGLRLAGAGKQVGMTEAQTLSLAGALSSVGIEAEAGGSAVSKVMVEMQLASEKGGKALDNFANVAGMSADGFKKAFKDDAAGALIAFIKGLETSSERGVSAIKVLDDMGITEVRMRDALLRAAGAGDLFSESIQIGTKAWEENNALTKEAEQRYGTTESKLKMMWNRLKDVAITLGEALVPAILAILDAVNPIIGALSKLATWFANLDTGARKIIIGIAAFAAALGPILMVVGKIVTGVGALLAAFSTVSAAIAVVTTGAAAATPAIGALAGVFTVLTGPVGIIVASIAALTAGLIYLYNNNETVKNALNAAWEFLKSAAMSIFNALKEFWAKWGDDILGFFSATWEVIKTVFQTVFNVISEVVKTVFGAIKDFWDKWGDTIIGIFKGYFEILKIFWGTIFNAIFAVVKAIFDDIKSFWDTWGDTIMVVFKTIFNVVKTIFEGAWNGIKIVIETVIGVISGIIKTFLSIFKGDWAGAWEGAKQVASSIWNGITGIFKNSFETMKNVGKNIIEGLINGIKSMASVVVDTAKDIASSIGDSVKGFFGIHSPSRLMLGYGKNIVQGLANGISETARQAVKSASAVSDAVAGAMALDVSGVSSAVSALNGVSAPSIAGTTTNSTSVSFADMFRGANFNVRNDNDIKLIAQELGGVVTQNIRALGGV